jgi:hypothetical protein
LCFIRPCVDWLYRVDGFGVVREPNPDPERRRLPQLLDIATIAATLIAWADTNPSGLSINTEDTNDTGTERTIAFLAADRKSIGGIVEELFNTANRNFRFDTYFEDGQPVTYLYTDSHRETGFVLEVGAQVIGGDVQIDGTEQVSSVDATGSGNVAPITVEDTDRLDEILPLDAVVSETDVTTTANLNIVANHRLAEGAAPISLPKITVSPTASPSLGEY